MVTTRKVLVVDDDVMVGKSIHRVLSEKGYQVWEALNGREALEELGHQDYDLVLTDIKMPGMDGLEVASRVKKLHPGLPVVIITGYGTEENENRAMALGVSGFLRKPLTPAMIIENAELALREKRETMEAVRRSALTLAAPTPTAETAVAAETKESVVKNLALFIAAPFIGLAYILAFPFIGVYAMGKYGYKALTGGR